MLREDAKTNGRIIIEEARDGLQAFEMFKNCSNSKCSDPDCKDKFYRAIIMDLQMPVMDGFEASEKILEYQSRQPNLAHKCKIVALTAYTNQETIQRCLDIGM